MRRRIITWRLATHIPWHRERLRVPRQYSCKTRSTGCGGSCFEEDEATRAQEEERNAIARYVPKYLEKAFPTETGPPGTADWFLFTPHIDFIGCFLFDFIGSGDRSNEVGILLGGGIVD